jgi:hypothetical protein
VHSEAITPMEGAATPKPHIPLACDEKRRYAGVRTRVAKSRSSVAAGSSVSPV